MRKATDNSPKPNSESNPNAAWEERQTRDADARRLYEQERLIAWMTEELASAIEESGLTRSQLAERLGTSKAHVTQVLRGSRNLTLRSVADLAWVTGHRIHVAREPLRSAPYISSPVCMTKPLKQNIVVQEHRTGEWECPSAPDLGITEFDFFSEGSQTLRKRVGA